MTKLACNTATHKHCPMCTTVKPREDFYRNKNSHDGLQGRCKPCNIEMVRQYHKKFPERHAAYNRGWDKRNPEKKKDTALKTRLGVEAGTYSRMLAEQEGKCGICATSDTSPHKRFHVDHCGEKGTVRGLLCNNCNIGIGQFHHSIPKLEAAIRYLAERG